MWIKVNHSSLYNLDVTHEMVDWRNRCFLTMRYRFQAPQPIFFQFEPRLGTPIQGRAVPRAAQGRCSWYAGETSSVLLGSLRGAHVRADRLINHLCHSPTIVREAGINFGFVARAIDKSSESYVSNVSYEHHSVFLSPLGILFEFCASWDLL